MMFEDFPPGLKLYCPIHGEQNGHISISLPTVKGLFCHECFSHIIADHCERLIVIPRLENDEKYKH